MRADGNEVPLRFDTLAALLDHNEALSEQAGAWTGRDGEPLCASDARLLDEATEAEWELADAIRGPVGALSDGDATAIAGLLRLADDSSLKSALAIGLRKAFLDREPADLAVEFSSVYSHLALPSLFGGAREQAQALLGALDSLS